MPLALNKPLGLSDVPQPVVAGSSDEIYAGDHYHKYNDPFLCRLTDPLRVTSATAMMKESGKTAVVNNQSELPL